MATLIPVIKSRMGNTDYFQSTMLAQELVNTVRPARELDEWSSLGIEERMQREINQRRVINEIAPYLLREEDRFFGSIVVLVYKPKQFEFEGLQDLSISVPKAYGNVAAKMGFLTIDGGSLITLDGQHRWQAYYEIIRGGISLEGPYFHDIPSDELSVIFINFEDIQKTRRIFNKINRHAKATSRSDNLITSEDDAAAIIARMLLRSEGPLGIKDGKGDYIVNWKSNTISARSLKITTLGSVYQTVSMILKHHDFAAAQDIHFRPTEDEIQEMYQVVSQWWTNILTRVTGYKEAIESVSRIPQLRAMEERDSAGDISTPESQYSLLFRPVGLEALVGGVILAMERSDGELDLEEALFRANQIDWRVSADHWGGTIVRHDEVTPDQKRIQAGRANVALGSQLVAFLVGHDYMDAYALEELKVKYLVRRGIPSDQIEFTDIESHAVPITTELEEEIPI